jgi:hypothetical protein
MASVLYELVDGCMGQKEDMITYYVAFIAYFTYHNFEIDRELFGSMPHIHFKLHKEVEDVINASAALRWGNDVVLRGKPDLGCAFLNIFRTVMTRFMDEPSADS